LKIFAEKLKDHVKTRAGGNKPGADLQMKNGDWVEQKAWSPEAWINRGPNSKQNANMLTGLREQVERYVKQNPNGRLIVEFAWGILKQVQPMVDSLKSQFGDKLVFMSDVWRYGGWETLLK